MAWLAKLDFTKPVENNPRAYFYLSALSVAIPTLYFGVTKTRVVDAALLYYLIFTAVILLVSAWGYFGKQDASSSLLDATDLTIVAIVILLAWGMRFYHVWVPSIWLDEDNQAQVGLAVLSQDNMVLAAALQQQPPLDYFFTALGMGLFGVNPFGARFFPALLGGLSVVLFYLLVRRLIEQRSIAVASTSLFLFNPWLVGYSQEARPFSTSIFFEIIYLHLLVDFMACRFSRKSWVLLISSATLFLMTISFQPMMILGILTVTMFLMWPDPAWRKKILAVAGANALAFIVFIPILLLILRYSSGHFSESESLIFPVFSRQMWFSAFHHLSLLKGSIKSFYPWIFWPSCVILVIRFRKHRHLPHDIWFLVYFLALAILYPLLYTGVFHWALQYPLRTRYLLAYLPLLFLAFALCLNFLLDHIKKITSIARIVAVGFSVLLSFLSFRDFEWSAQQIYTTKMLNTADWKSVYSFLKEFRKSDGKAYLFTLNRYTDWSPDGFLGVEFYYPHSRKQAVSLVSQWDYANRKEQVELIADDLEKGMEPKNIFFVSTNWWNRRVLTREDFSGFDNIAFRDFRNIHVIWLENRHGFSMTLQQFFQRLDERIVREKDKGKVIEMLLRLAFYEKRASDAKIYLQRLQTLNRHGIIQDKLDRYEKNRSEVFSPEKRE